MQIGVISDTHGHVRNSLDAVRMLESLEVQLVIHCGDVGSASIVELFSSWPTHFVLGNVDHDEQTMRRAIEAAGQTYHGRFGTLELEGRRIAFLHGDDDRRLQESIASGQWDLVCYGHTHIAEHHRARQTWVLNPGALYRANPHTIAIVELRSLELSIVRI